MVLFGPLHSALSLQSWEGQTCRRSPAAGPTVEPGPVPLPWCYAKHAVAQQPAAGVARIERMDCPASVVRIAAQHHFARNLQYHKSAKIDRDADGALPAEDAERIQPDDGPPPIFDDLDRPRYRYDHSE